VIFGANRPGRVINKVKYPTQLHFWHKAVYLAIFFFFGAQAIQPEPNQSSDSDILDRVTAFVSAHGHHSHYCNNEAEDLDKKAMGGSVADRVPTKFHPIVVAPDKSVVIEALGENSPGGRLAAAIGDGELDQNAPVRKTDLIDYGADHTVPASHDSNVPRALLHTVSIKRSLQVVTPPDTTTCTLIANYNMNETANSICDLTATLAKLLPDGNKDVSAIDVALCWNKKNCRKNSGGRRLISGSVGHTKSPQATGDIHAPFDSTIRFLQSINTPPPTSAPAFGYIVFTATADKLNCTEIAAKLESTISSLVSVMLAFRKYVPYLTGTGSFWLYWFI
jgi:hypothetical protein